MLFDYNVYENLINSGCKSPLRARDYQPTTDHASLTFLQTEVNGHPSSLRVTFGQYVETSSR